MLYSQLAKELFHSLVNILLYITLGSKFFLCLTSP
jgi:hypothetical protein